MSGDRTSALSRDVEMRVRIILTNDQALEVTVFLLSSHRNDSPIDNLHGFLNSRRGQFLHVKTGDGQELLLQMHNILAVELMNDTAEQLRLLNPAMMWAGIYSNEKFVVAYAPVVLTMSTGRTLRGDLWFYEFDHAEDRNVTTAFNREGRYIILHCDKSTIFVNRDWILKVGMPSALHGDDSTLSHPNHVKQRCGLVDTGAAQPAKEIVGAAEHLSRAMGSDDAHMQAAVHTPSAPGRSAPAQAPTPAPAQAKKFFPFAPRNSSGEIKLDLPDDMRERPDKDETHWY